MEKIVGIYHANCTDGTAAAAVLLRKFPETTLVPLPNGYTPEELALAREHARGAETVYILDCALGVKELLEDGHNVVVLDHHMSSKEEMETLSREHERLTFVFDNEKSGASLAWEHFFPDEETPLFISYVEDNDLWTKKYGEERAHVISYVSMFRNKPEMFLPYLDGDLAEPREKGKVISTYVDNEIAHLIETPMREMRVGEYLVPAFNITVHKSACGALLSEKLGKAVALYTIKGERVTISFRSKEGQAPSSRVIAEALDGGGHEHSAAARVSFDDFIALIA